MPDSNIGPVFSRQGLRDRRAIPASRTGKVFCDPEEVKPGMQTPILSVIIPVYNEAATLPELLRRVLAVPVLKEILIVDDGSTDGTRDFLKTIWDNDLTVVRHDANWGKGAAIRTAIQHARGEFVIIQDGDLEYEPMDYLALLQAIYDSEGVVYGSRNLKPRKGKFYLRYWIGGMALTQIANTLYGFHLTDETTGYKLFRASLIRSLNLKCDGFEFCAEVTAKLGRRKIRIKEVPISYSPRKFEEGKKIRWTDGLKAIWTLLKLRFVG
jgi:glycosyltransferase involved in cell wall biosynthesis